MVIKLYGPKVMSYNDEKSKLERTYTDITLRGT